jgi:hypothetical protein
MALGIRFIALRSTLWANGRSYSATVGSVIDVPYADAVAIGPDQGTRLMVTGATVDRPGNVPGMLAWPPSTMYDTTLSAPIFLVPNSNPARWVDISGAAA